MRPSSDYDFLKGSNEVDDLDSGHQETLNVVVETFNSAKRSDDDAHGAEEKPVRES